MKSGDRFNLGFGIMGVPEQHKDGKYCLSEDLDRATWKARHQKSVLHHLLILSNVWWVSLLLALGYMVKHNVC